VAQKEVPTEELKKPTLRPVTANKQNQDPSPV
jgi:hypothetical protein